MFPLKLKLGSDIRGLNQRMAIYARELKLQPAAVVKMQAGLLSRELAEGAAPRSRQALERAIDRDIGRVYAPAPTRMIPLAHRQGKGFVWIAASLQAVVGVKPYDYHLEDSVEDLQRLFHKTNPRGNRYVPLGARRETMSNRIMRTARGRGSQKAVQLNRIVVRRGVFQAFSRDLKNRGGILGGSWVIAWPALQPKGRKPPAYKFRHVEDGTARGTYVDGLGIPGHPTFSLVNRAAGCTKPSQLEMLRGKIISRSESMKADMQNILRGAYKRAGFKKA